MMQMHKARRRLEHRENAPCDKAQKNKLEAVFEAIADGLVVYDQQGSVVQANPAARRILGLEEAQLCGYDQLPARERASYSILYDEYDQPLAYEQLPFIRILRGETL